PRSFSSLYTATTQLSTLSLHDALPILNQGFSWIKPYIFGAAFRIRELPVFCARTCHFTAATRCSRGKQGNILNERSCLVGDIVDVKINQQGTQPSAAYQACPRPE